jgi:site-specific DNA-methyltransferase (adenine-specific)
VNEAGKRGYFFRHTPYCPLNDQTPPSNSLVFLQDCISGMRNLPEACVDLIVSDPPYLINYRTHHRNDKEHEFCTPIQNDNNPDLIRKYIAECYRILKPDSAFYCFCSERTQQFFTEEAVKAGFKKKNAVIWVKNEWTAGDLQAAFGFQYEMILLFNKGRAFLQGKRMGDVWQIPRVAGKHQVHQNQKPLELIKRCIIYHSKPGDTVFDGFMGSGTTAVAARELGRRFLGFEIEPKYFDIITDRLREGNTSGP